MKAAARKAINVVEVEDVPEPVTQPHQIEVKIAYAGISGSDIEIIHGKFGLVDLEPLISHVYPLDKIKGEVMKALIKP